MNHPTDLTKRCIDCMIKNFKNKWIPLPLYEKCLRKFHCSTIAFEDNVNVMFKQGYIKIIEEKPMGHNIKWVWDIK